MTKYTRPPFFTSAYSNISPPATSFDMARSSSRDSTTSTINYSNLTTCAYASLTTSHPLSRSSSSTSTSSTQHQSASTAPTSAPAMRRTSSTSSTSSNSGTWLASPYRSCLTQQAQNPNDSSNDNCFLPTSYLSDDDLLSLSLPVESIPTPAPAKRELTTEEQIARLRELQEQEETVQQGDNLRHNTMSSDISPRRKQVRFQPSVTQDKSSRRPSTLKRRTTAVRRGLSGLNGPL